MQTILSVLVFAIVYLSIPHTVDSKSATPTVAPKQNATWADVRSCFTKTDCQCPKNISVKAQQFVDVIKRCVGSHRDDFWTEIFNCTKQKETSPCWKVSSTAELSGSTLGGAGDVPDFVAEAADCWKQCTVQTNCFAGCGAKEDPLVNKALKACVPQLKAQMQHALKTCKVEKSDGKNTIRTDPPKKGN